MGGPLEGAFPVDHLDAAFAIAACKTLLSYASLTLASPQHLTYSRTEGCAGRFQADPHWPAEMRSDRAASVSGHP